MVSLLNWTVYEVVLLCNGWAFLKGPPVLCSFNVQVLELEMTRVDSLRLTCVGPPLKPLEGRPEGPIFGPPPGPPTSVSGPMIGGEADISIWKYNMLFLAFEVMPQHHRSIIALSCSIYLCVFSNNNVFTRESTQRRRYLIYFPLRRPTTRPHQNFLLLQQAKKFVKTGSMLAHYPFKVDNRGCVSFC